MYDSLHNKLLTLPDETLGLICAEAADEPVASAPPALRERAARLAARASLPLLCRAVLLTQYGALAQARLQSPPRTARSPRASTCTCAPSH